MVLCKASTIPSAHDCSYLHDVPVQHTQSDLGTWGTEKKAKAKSPTRIEILRVPTLGEKKEAVMKGKLRPICGDRERRLIKRD